MSDWPVTVAHANVAELVRAVQNLELGSEQIGRRFGRVPLQESRARWLERMGATKRVFRTEEDGPGPLPRIWKVLQSRGCLFEQEVLWLELGGLGLLQFVQMLHTIAHWIESC